MAGLAPIIHWIAAVARDFCRFSEVSMSGTARFALVVTASLLAAAPALAQRSTTGSAPPLVQEPGAPPIANTPAAPQPQQASGKTATPANCSNPNALGIARTVEIDTTGGPGFGFEHFRQH